MQHGKGCSVDCGCSGRCSNYFGQHPLQKNDKAKEAGKEAEKEGEKAGETEKND